MTIAVGVATFFLMLVLIMVALGSISTYVKNNSLKEEPFKVLSTLVRLGLLLGVVILIIVYWKIVVYTGALLLLTVGLMLVTVMFVAVVALFMLSPALTVLWVYNSRPMREREWQNSWTYSILVSAVFFTSLFMAVGLLATLMEIPAPALDSMMNQLAHWAF